MEPAQVEVKVLHHRRITEVHSPEPNSWWFRIEDWPVKFWLQGTCDVQPSDRVRITITKEPNDANT